MADKKGWSEERTDIFGNKYIQHFDEDGSKVGWSEERTGLFGDTYVQHHDQSGTKTGWSEERAGIFRDSYVQHHDQSGSKAGWSESRSGIFGDDYVQHHDQSGAKAGWSEERTGLFGGRYKQHYERVPPRISRVAENPGFTKLRRPRPTAAAPAAKKFEWRKALEPWAPWIMALVVLGISLFAVQQFKTAGMSPILFIELVLMGVGAFLFAKLIGPKAVNSFSLWVFLALLVFTLGYGLNWAVFNPPQPRPETVIQTRY